MRIIESSRGFTMIEMVIALTISAVLVGFATYFITAPMDAYVDHAARAQLTASSENITRTMTDDLKNAVPNSVRISSSGGRTILELLRVEGMAYFRPQGALSGPSSIPTSARELSFGAADGQFSTFGSISPGTATSPYGGPGVELPGGHLVIGNLGYNSGIGTDAYRVAGGSPNVITPSGTKIWLNRDPLTHEETITLDPLFRFTSPVPANVTRVFWVRTPVTYICNTNTNTLRRFSEYPITDTTPTDEGSPQFSGARMSLLAENVVSCRFECGPNNDRCQSLFVVDMTVARAAGPENDVLRVLEQVPLDNAK